MPEKTKRISLVLSENMIRALKAASKRERRPQSIIIREALSNYLGVEDKVQYGGQGPSNSTDEHEGDVVAVA